MAMRGGVNSTGIDHAAAMTLRRAPAALVTSTVGPWLIRRLACSRATGRKAEAAMDMVASLLDRARRYFDRASAAAHAAQTHARPRAAGGTRSSRLCGKTAATHQQGEASPAAIAQALPTPQIGQRSAETAPADSSAGAGPAPLMVAAARGARP